MLDGGAMFGVVPKSIWQKTNPADSNNMIQMAARCLLIEDGKRLMLVDAGMGDKAKRFQQHPVHRADKAASSKARCIHGTQTALEEALEFINYWEAIGNERHSPTT